MRLGFYYHSPARCDASGRIRVPSYLGVFIDSLADHCEQVVCFLHSPLPIEEESLNYTIRHSNVTLVDIGPHVSVPQRILNAARFTEPLRQWRDRLDVVLLRGPSPLLGAMANAVGDLPLAVLLVGDYLAEARAAQGRLTPRRLIVRLWLEWNLRQQVRIVRKHLTFVNSRQLYQDFAPIAAKIVETQTTTLSSADFFEREDTCAAPPYRILFSGRIVRAKGVTDILDAVLALRDEGVDIRFDLVGLLDPGDDILSELVETARARGAADSVTYHGLKAVGDELFGYYKQADIYAIASRSSFEGFPRTVWEAMAHSTPVIATTVGSIPLFLKDEETALLVEPNNVPALKAAIRRMIEDAALRRRLIAQGREIVRDNTLENRAGEIVRHLTEWIDHRERV